MKLRKIVVVDEIPYLQENLYDMNLRGENKCNISLIV